MRIRGIEDPDEIQDYESNMLSALMAMVILRGSSDTLSFTMEEYEAVRRAFPNGYALVAFGDMQAGRMGLRLVGRESEALVEQVVDEAKHGEVDTLRRLFPDIPES